MAAAPLHRHPFRLTPLLISPAFILVLALTCTAQSQAPANQRLPDPPSNKPGKEDSDPRFGTPENEAKAKMALKEEKKKYDENLARAKEVSELASQLCLGYESRKSFNNEDGKKLDRLEKLTKRIRNEAGGSESEPDDETKDISAKMEETLKHLADVAEDLNKLVEKTPRNVVSAAVIDQANRLLVITQHLRSNR